MSKKKVISSNTNNNETIEKEEVSKAEKIFVRCVIIIGAALILLIIILNINTGGDKNMLARKYKSITSDNIFEIIKYDQCINMIETRDEDFQVLFIQKEYEKSDYYIWCVDRICKETENDNIQTVYILDTSYLSSSESLYFKNLLGESIKQPTLIHFGRTEDTIVEKCVDLNSTVRYNLDNYENNYWNLLVKYFNDCEYAEKEVVEE